MSPPRRAIPLARLAAVVAIGLMGAALLVTVWTTHAGVNDASETLVRGQADTFQQAIRVRLMDLQGPPTSADLSALVQEHWAVGLRYVVVQEPSKAETVHGGAATAGAIAPAFAAAPPERPVHVGEGRVRMFFRAIQRVPGSEPRKRPYLVAIEFRPVKAENLRAAAWGTLGIGALAASTLLVIAAMLVRWVLRREASATERERARRLASLGELSAVLAHEIRNPLASLKGNAQLLAQLLPTGEKPRAKADRVVDEAIRLENLSNDLLEFVRTGELELAPHDPAALLSAAAEAVAPEHIQVDVSGAPASWPLDAARMAQVLTNLLENAVQAGAPVLARVAAQANRLIFEVRDSGPGVPEDERERIFEPFYTKRTRGTGLGLAVAKRVVELHRGSISVADVAGGGAIFRVVLPRG
jgi:two-component system, NtrC family, sensor histidine kinase HydH